MLFSSPVFIFLFLPLSLLLYYATGRKNIVLLSISLLFYAWGEPILVLVIISSIVVNYILGRCIDKYQSSNRQLAKIFLIFGICANLMLLMHYKYFDYFASFINQALDIADIARIEKTNIPLLLGVSFFSFQAMGYLIDIYRKEYHAQTNILNFALFKTFFPQLIAGPIVRYSEISTQLDDRKHGTELFAEGVELFIIGLAKKVLIADVLAVSVDKMFEVPVSEMSASVAWTAVFLFGLQIYFDFSGYTNMALGLGKMFGFHLPKNFNYPYMASTVQDFWRRWHMTLSRWFRDYLYIPLGGNRKGAGRTAFNLFIVFLLCGLWHGANTTFVVWGVIHGFFLMLERTRFGVVLGNTPKFVQHMYFFIVLMFSWMVFRATSIDQAIGIGEAMLGFNGWSNEHYSLRLYADNLTWLSTVLGVVFSFPAMKWLQSYWTENKNLLTLFNNRLQVKSSVVRVMSYCSVLIISFAFIGAQTHRAFIYFRF